MPRNASARILLSTIVGMGLAITAATARADDAGETVKRVFSSQLANVPGQTMTVLTVNYAPGAKSTQHHHAGSVFAYILSGAVRSENSATGPAKVYKAGETFFEPPGSHHLVSENASATEPASMLVVFVAEDGAVLKTIDK